MPNALKEEYPESNLSKRLTRIRSLMNDPQLVRDDPERMCRLVKSATYGWMDIRMTKPI